ncbi:pilus assembly protein PilM, partial [Patescibacteria group bacterium]|nr:pilus assembly protein PilM [Patescibacteria group bacterium]
VDIGASGARIAEITERDHHAWLSNYGYLAFPQAIDTSLPSNQERQTVQKALSEICRQAKFSTTKAYSVIPGHCAANQIYNFDQQTPKTVIESWLADNMPTKHLGASPLIKWQKINTSTGGKTDTVHASAAAKHVISHYQNLLKGAGLDLQGLETVFHALGRSLAGSDHRPAMIIAAGNKNTDVIITQHGHPLITHSLEFGGQEITNTIAKHLNIGIKEAEQFKKDRQLTATGNNNDSLDQAITKKREQLQQELREILAAALRKNIKVDKTIVSGGCAYDQEFVSWLEKSLGIKTYPGNPWGRVAYQNSIKPLLAEISHFFPVAVGAAMKGLE